MFKRFILTKASDDVQVIVVILLNKLIQDIADIKNGSFFDYASLNIFQEVLKCSNYFSDIKLDISKLNRFLDGLKKFFTDKETIYENIQKYSLFNLSHDSNNQLKEEMRNQNFASHLKVKNHFVRELTVPSHIQLNYHKESKKRRLT